MERKIHLFKRGPDCRDMGQSEFEYANTTACGYVRDRVTNDPKKVTCKLCKKEIPKAT